MLLDHTSVLCGHRTALAAVLVLICAGCGGPDYGTAHSVTGTIKLDGTPLSGVTVIFHCSGGLPAELRTRRATSDEQGVYTMPEVYSGEYSVVFERVMEVPENPGDAPADLATTDDPLARYTGDNSLSADVSETNTEFNFELETKS